MKPTFSDWFVWFIFLLFTIMGIFIIFSGKDFSVGVVCMAFFGSGFALFTKIIRDKYRQNRLFKQDMVLEKLPLDYPFYMSKAKYYLMFIILILLSSILVVFTYEKREFIGLICAIIMFLVGFIGLIAGLFGKMSDQYLQLEKQGLRICYGSYSYIVHWENIAKVGAGDYHSNPIITVDIIDVDKLLETIEAEKNRDKKMTDICKNLRRSKDWLGCHIMLRSNQYSLDQATLYKNIEEYLPTEENITLNG